MIALSTDPSEQLTHLRRMVGWFRPPSQIDRDDLVSTLWIRYYNGQERSPTWNEVRWAIVDAIRHDKVRRKVEWQDVPSPPPPDEDLDRELVQLLLNRTPLTPRQIDIFYRHYWKDETFASMASELGLPVDEVRTLHTYALEKLKRTSAAR